MRSPFTPNRAITDQFVKPCVLAITRKYTMHSLVQESNNHRSNQPWKFISCTSDGMILLVVIFLYIYLYSTSQKCKTMIIVNITFTMIAINMDIRYCLLYRDDSFRIKVRSAFNESPKPGTLII